MKNIKNKTTKSAKSRSSKFVDIRGLDTKKNYSSFWMDDKWDAASKFAGLDVSAGSASSDLVKLVKLSNYRRAVSNFVKIVTNKDIPVLWAGRDSYTDGHSITLSSDIKDDNFDVTVGLALHEASHIILTDFKLASSVPMGTHPKVENLPNIGDLGRVASRSFLFSLLNWVEDRRIDHFVFSTSPGYKAYYHKLYDHYWNNKDIHKGFNSKQFGDKNKSENWMFHIINMMNLSFNPKALPGLEDVVKVVDLHNISRLKSTEDALDVAIAVYNIIQSIVEEPQPENDQQQNDTQSGEGEGEGEDKAENSGVQNTGDNSQGETGTDGEEEKVELSSKELASIEAALEKQKDFLKGKVSKKTATKKMQKQLDEVAEQSIDIQTVGGTDGVRSTTCLMYDLSKNQQGIEFSQLINTYHEAQELNKGYWDALSVVRDHSLCNVLGEIGRGKKKTNMQYIQAGLDMGGLLGKKLQLHNESRERVDTRLRTGKIDNKRLAHAGYGIEGVFKQISIDKHKKANLHISLDGSGSMSGTKWNETLQMTMAIAKAITYTQNINLQVNIRCTVSGLQGDTPVVLSLYDSRVNKINHLVALLSVYAPNSMTPEGLCFEAMMKKNMFVPTSNEVDSYFLNLSDGDPNCGGYHGHNATSHTASVINKMRSNLNMSILSFWIDVNPSRSFFDTNGYGQSFIKMYGKDAAVVDAKDAMGIAKALNKKFLSC